MKLSQYPQVIHDSKQRLLEADRFVRRLQQQYDRIVAKIDSAVAFDVELKNEQQRKARRNELLVAPDSQDIAEQLQAAEDKLAEMEADHQFLLNRFAVAKLEVRETIAQMELEASHQAA